MATNIAVDSAVIVAASSALMPPPPRSRFSILGPGQGHAPHHHALTGQLGPGQVSGLGQEAAQPAHAQRRRHAAQRAEQEHVVAQLGGDPGQGRVLDERRRVQGGEHGRLGHHHGRRGGRRAPAEPARPDEAGDRAARPHGQHHDGEERDQLGDERALPCVLQGALRATEELGQRRVRAQRVEALLDSRFCRSASGPEAAATRVQSR